MEDIEIDAWIDTQPGWSLKISRESIPLTRRDRDE